MKKLLLLFIMTLSLVSCTSEPLPKDIQATIKDKGKYLIHWDSNQGDAFVELTIIHANKTTEIANYQDRNIDVILSKSDTIEIHIGYGQAINPAELYLSISKDNGYDIYNGVYTPGQIKLLYEQEIDTNGFMLTTAISCLDK